MAYSDLCGSLTPVFTRRIIAILDEDRYRFLLLALALRPEQGALIRGSGGLRKLRWSVPGRGKRGSVRIIYYWDKPAETFFMLFAYTKQEQGDLTPKQVKILGQLIRKEFK
jgi:mRNA-degrading endonuclease RelE of RelBE toxin-antitoxin system